MLKLVELQKELGASLPRHSRGKVLSVQGPLVICRLPRAAIGDICRITMQDGRFMPAQVVSFHADLIRLAPFDSLQGISPGSEVISTGRPLALKISPAMVGRIFDSLGQEIEWNSGCGAAVHENRFEPGADSHPEYSILRSPPAALSRKPIRQQLKTGIRCIDSLCSIGYGQRIGLFAEAGVGKSTLLGMIARNADVDICIIALVGERGREVNEFIQESLAVSGRRKSIVILATSDESAARRQLAPMTATAIAEYFRDQGQRVLLLIDSLTRAARAIREVGLAAGEIPVRQGYTSSVYSELPKLLERSGTNHLGSITAVYTVLTNPENDIDPLADEVKSLLDGHLVLDRRIAEEGIRPAVDLNSSVSRLLNNLHNTDYLAEISTVLNMLARLRRDKDILLFGGTPDKELQAALELEKSLKDFLNQTPEQNHALQDSMRFVSQTAGSYLSRIQPA